MANAKKLSHMPLLSAPISAASTTTLLHSSSSSSSSEVSVDLLPCSNELANKLAELRRRLTPKPFKSHFVDSLIYLIQLEHRNQTAFDEVICSSHIQWSQLEYALNELKKIIKQKQAIRSLITKMQLNSQPLKDKQQQQQQQQQLETVMDAVYSNCSNSSSMSSVFDDYSDISNSCPDKIELSTELNDLSTNKNNDELFSLTKILVRFLFKLLKLKVSFSLTSNRLNKQLFNLKLISLSCLADLFNFEDIKMQVSVALSLILLFLFFC